MIAALIILLASVQSGTTIEVEAILVYGNRNVKPVAQTHFIVLDKDIESILHDANVGCELPTVLPSDQKNGCPDVLETFSRIDKWNDRQKASRVSSLVETHVVTSASTDFDGKMTLTKLPLKTKLWLFGIFETPMSARRHIWNVPLETSSLPTHSKFILNNYNLHIPGKGLRNLKTIQQ